VKLGMNIMLLQPTPKTYF